MVDLTKVTRDSDKIRTQILIKTCRYKPATEWLVFGQMELRQDIYPNWIAARSDATDFEHDSIYILRLPIIGVRLSGVRYGKTFMEGYVHPHAEDDFHVPTSSDYDPEKEDGSMLCEDCAEPHIIVPEGFYVPKFNKELYEKVRGHQIMIVTGTPNEE